MATDSKNEHNNVGRRDFVQATTLAGAALAGFASQALAQEPSRGSADSGPTESRAHITSKGASEPKADQTTADILVATLIEWGGTHVFGMVGEPGISILSSKLFENEKDEIQFVGVRHEVRPQPSWLAALQSIPGGWEYASAPRGLAPFTY